MPRFYHVTLPHIRRELTYLPHPHTTIIPAPGTRVRVPYRQTVVTGWLNHIAHACELSPTQLKPVDAVIDSEPVIDPSLWHTLQWLSHYYHQPFDKLLAHLLPKSLVHGPYHRWTGKPLGLNPSSFSSKLPIQYRKLLALFDESPTICLYQALQQRIQAPCVAEYTHLSTHSPPCQQPTHLNIPPLPALHSQQATIVRDILSLSAFQAHVLHGVTGSGKTRIYQHLIAKHLEKNGQILLLIPEINLLPQLQSAMQELFADHVVVYHSELSEREKTITIDKLLHQHAHILLGTRSALFLPLPQLRLIIVDESHDTSFSSQSGLHYHGRDVAIVRAKHADIPIVLGSATPDLSTYYHAQAQNYHYHPLFQRASHTPLPDIRIVSHQHPHAQWLHPTIIERIQHCLDRGEQALVFLNRRGYAPVLMCHACGHHLSCTSCDKPMTLHHKDGSCRCHRCDKSMATPPECQSCHSQTYQPLGCGTEKLVEKAQQAFPHATLLQMDKDAQKSAKDIALALDKIRDGSCNLIVGTQLMVKGHHFPNLTLSVIVDVDSSLFSSDYRALERLYQTIHQVAGRVGRTPDARAEVLLQTLQPHHPIWPILTHADPQHAPHHLLQARQQALMPPFRAYAAYELHLASAAKVMSQLRLIRDKCLQMCPEAELIGPYPSPVPKRANHYYGLLTISAPNKPSLQAICRAVHPSILQIRTVSQRNLSLIIDPDML